MPITEMQKKKRRSGSLTSSQTLIFDNVLLFFQVQCKLLEEKDHSSYHKCFTLPTPVFSSGLCYGSLTTRSAFRMNE